MSEEFEIDMDPTPSSNHALIVALFVRACDLEKRVAALEADAAIDRPYFKPNATMPLPKDDKA